MKNFKLTWLHVLAAAIVVVWGTTFISTKVLLQAGLAPESIFFYRFLVAYVGIWFFGKSPLLAKSRRDELTFALLGISGGSVYFLTENYALKVTQVSNVSLLVCTAPLITALLSHVFLVGERLHKRLVQGLLLALVGVSLVVFNGHFVLQLHPLGDLLSIAAALCWAVYTIVLKRVSERYSTLFITRKVFFYGLITILPVMLTHSPTAEWQALQQPLVLANLAFLAVAASLLCYFFWNLVVKRLGAVRATNYIYFVPLVTLAASFLFLSEVITALALLGAALVLLGVFWAERRNAENRL